MSFFENVITGIEKLGGGTFGKDGIMEIHLNQDACFFLDDLDNFSGLLTPKNNFTKIFNYSDHVQLVYTGTIGLSFKKTNDNSIGDRVNPEFINALKKSSLAYINILLTANWKQSTAKTRKIVLKSLKKQDDPNIICVENLFKNMGNTYTIISQIKKAREDIDIEIEGTTSGNVFLVGEDKNIADFCTALNEELTLIKEKVEMTEDI